MFSTILMITTRGTPSRNARYSTSRESDDVARSPAPGMRPTIGSQPNRNCVPGTR